MRLQSGPYWGPDPDRPRVVADEERARAEVAARIRAWQVDALDATALSGTMNLPAVILTAFFIRQHIDARALGLWIGAAAVLAVALIATAYGPFRRRANTSPPLVMLHRQLAFRTALAAAIGAVWGGAALAFAPRLDHVEMLYFLCIVLGCNAACISGLGSFLPAFVGYCSASALPLALATYVRHDSWSGNLTLLILLFIATVGLNTRLYNRQVLAALSLRAENETLAVSVVNANAATAEATRTKWNTLAHLSHELRTPMNAIIGFSQIMRDEMFGPLGKRYHTYAGHILESGRRTLELIDSILEVAEAGHIALRESEFAPEALVRECIGDLSEGAAAKGVALEMGPAPALVLTADRARLRLVLVNLLTNAIRYSHVEGRVSVTFARHSDGFAIAVVDEGVGISPSDLAKCLEPFVRIGNPLVAGVAGAGLGLPMARRLVEAHGGRLELESTLGQGTTATIHLPSERLSTGKQSPWSALAPRPDFFDAEVAEVSQRSRASGAAAR